MPLSCLKSRGNPWKANHSTSWQYSDGECKPSYLTSEYRSMKSDFDEGVVDMAYCLRKLPRVRAGSSILKGEAWIKAEHGSGNRRLLTGREPPSDCFQLTCSHSSGERMVRTERAMPALPGTLEQPLATSWLCWLTQRFLKALSPHYSSQGTCSNTLLPLPWKLEPYYFCWF